MTILGDNYGVIEGEVKKKIRLPKIRFDYSINLTNIIALISLIATLWSYGNKVITHFKVNESKIAIMWLQFSSEHPDLAKQLETIQKEN